MGSVVIVVVALVLALVVLRVVRARRSSLVPRRGYGVEADMAAMDEREQVRISSLAAAGAGSMRLRLESLLGSLDPEQVDPAAGTTRDLVVAVTEGDFAHRVLQGWYGGEHRLALVAPPGGRLIRLRSLDDLQHLTLRRTDG